MFQSVMLLLKLMPDFENCDENDARKWLESNKTDYGYQILNYKEKLTL